MQYTSDIQPTPITRIYIHMFTCYKHSWVSRHIETSIWQWHCYAWRHSNELHILTIFVSKSFYVLDTLLIRLTTNTPRRPCLHCGTDLAAEPDWEKSRVKIAGERAKRSELWWAYSLFLCNFLVTAISLLIQTRLAAERESKKRSKKKWAHRSAGRYD